MLTERARKNPGEPIGFWKFLIVTSIVFTVLRSMLTGKSASTGGVLPFAFFAYFGYRIARLQPWWPFGEDMVGKPNNQSNNRSNSQSNNQPNNQSLGRVATAKKRVAVETNPLANRRPIREVGITNRRLPESDRVAANWKNEDDDQRVQTSGYVSESSSAMGSQVSSVGIRQKVERKKTVRSPTAERSKRR